MTIVDDNREKFQEGSYLTLVNSLRDLFLQEDEKDEKDEKDEGDEDMFDLGYSMGIDLEHERMSHRLEVQRLELERREAQLLELERREAQLRRFMRSAEMAKQDLRIEIELLQNKVGMLQRDIDIAETDARVAKMDIRIAERTRVVRRPKPTPTPTPTPTPKSNKYMCECGSEILHSSYSRHCKSQKHLKFEEQQPAIEV